VEDWYFENSCCKNGFFLFLVLKTGKLTNFTLDQFFFPLVFIGVLNVFYETKGLEPTLYSIATHCDILCSNSVLKAKNSQNSTNKTENPSSPYPRALY
jgi:hypothetical protein